MKTNIVLNKRQIATLRKIEDYIGKSIIRYDFWFVDKNTSWEGGFSLGGFDNHFRNQMSIYWDCIEHKYVITKNW